MAMKRLDGPPAGLQGEAHDEYFALEYPTLHAHLVETKWDDGKGRVTSSVMFLTESGRWKAWFHDRDAKMSAWVTADSWADLLKTVEGRLVEGGLDWRKDKR